MHTDRTKTQINENYLYYILHELMSRDVPNNTIIYMISKENLQRNWKKLFAERHNALALFGLGVVNESDLVNLPKSERDKVLQRIHMSFMGYAMEWFLPIPNELRWNSEHGQQLKILADSFRHGVGVSRNTNNLSFRLNGQFYIESFEDMMFMNRTSLCLHLSKQYQFNSMEEVLAISVVIHDRIVSRTRPSSILALKRKVKG